jgi:hypothetical protein
MGPDTLNTTIVLLPTTNDCRRGVVAPRYSKSEARFMIETLMLFARGFVICEFAASGRRPICP